MALVLVVREAFEDYKRGDRITHPDSIKVILASENAEHVIKSNQEVGE